ncbi:MAG TPA: acyltransferase [Candidatus Melainabacteria bacterium]|nr:acyltransferase [Candidatus Melainabacteria bacterium]
MTNQSSTDTNSELLGYKSQLDTLRLIAVMLVFHFHAGVFLQHNGNSFPYGALGVQIFFVLSGFLITRILEANQTGVLLTDLKTFYIRRCLRIFPAYYLLITFLLLLGQLPFPLYQFTYLFNLKVFLDGGFTGTIVHFWSLCVEEQFYLLYPLALLLVPRRFRIYLLVFLLVASMVANYFAGKYCTDRPYYMLLPVCGQFLLWGCLAGHAQLRGWTEKVNGTALFVAGLIFQSVDQFLVLNTKGFSDLNDLFWFRQYALSGFSLALIVLGLWQTKNRLLLKVFNYRPFAYLGKISYGIYLYHPFAFVVYILICYFSAPFKAVNGELIAFLVTVTWSILSWQLFESRVLKLKDLYAYRGGARTDITS